MFGTVGMLGIKNSKLSRVLAFKVDRRIHFARQLNESNKTIYKYYLEVSAGGS